MLPVLLGKSDADLDIDEEFINAVRVTTKRSQTPSFFARIFGINDLFLQTNAVAYLGFTSDLQPGEADQPVAICMQDILGWGTNKYTCNTGRMLNNTNQTAGWVDLDQPAAGTCNGGHAANPSNVRDDVCAGGNNQPIKFGIDIHATNGTDATLLSDLQECWYEQSDLISDPAVNKVKDKTQKVVDAPDKPWKLVLPVIDCCPPENPTCTNGKPSPCSMVVGAVEIDVLWITVNNPTYYPAEMGDWKCVFRYWGSSH